MSHKHLPMSHNRREIHEIWMKSMENPWNFNEIDENSMKLLGNRLEIHAFFFFFKWTLREIFEISMKPIRIHGISMKSHGNQWFFIETTRSQWIFYQIAKESMEFLWNRITTKEISMASRRNRWDFNQINRKSMKFQWNREQKFQCFILYFQMWGWTRSWKRAAA